MSNSDDRPRYICWMCGSNVNSVISCKSEGCPVMRGHSIVDMLGAIRDLLAELNAIVAESSRIGIVLHITSHDIMVLRSAMLMYVGYYKDDPDYTDKENDSKLLSYLNSHAIGR